LSKSNTGENVTLSLCVDASDKYLATSTKCISLPDVALSYSDAGMEALTASAMTLTSSQIDELLMTLASLEVTIPEYIRSPVQPHICTVDFQCSNGLCDRKSGNNHCKCHQGYAGQY